jgi:RNA polymerase sigma factor, sigma-70 family
MTEKGLQDNQLPAPEQSMENSMEDASDNISERKTTKKATDKTPERTKAYAGISPQQKEKLVADHLPLVKKIARGLARRSTDPVEDLIQVGSIGLLEAIERYETGHNTEFKTYAVHFITGHIRHYLRDRQNLLRGPRVLQELSYRLSQVTARLTQEFGREPTNQELADILQVTKEQVDEVKVYDRRVTVLWLDQEGNDSDDDEQRSLLESLSDPRFSSESREETDEKLVLTEAMSRLPEAQRQLLEMRYFHDLTQAELSRRLGISQMEVCRRLKKAEKQLKTVLTPNQKF